jgi:CBS domain-containing protein
VKVSDVMTSVPIAVRADASLVEAAQIMIEARVSGLPAIDEEGALVGMITEGDLVRRVELGTARRQPGWLTRLVSPGRVARDYVRAHGLSVREVMSADVISTSPDTPLSAVAEIMEAQQVKRLPVMLNGRLVGIVSRADLVRALTERLAQGNRQPGGAAPQIGAAPGVPTSLNSRR